MKDMIKTAKELKDKYDKDLKELQERCEHKNTTWCTEEWIIGHSTGYQVLSCSDCWKVIKRRFQCNYCDNLVEIEESKYKKLNPYHHYKHGYCSSRCKKKVW